MPFAEATVYVPIAPERAFELAHSLGVERASWDPGAATSRFVRGAEEDEQGTIRFIKGRDGMRFLLQTTAWHEPAASACKMVKGPSWLESYGESIRVEDTACGTKVTWKHTATVKRAFLPKLTAAGIEQWITARTNRRMAGFESAAHLLAFSE